MKQTIAVILFIFLLAIPARASVFFCEEAAVLRKNQVVLVERLVFEKYLALNGFTLFEENPSQALAGSFDRSLWAVPMEARIGIADNFTLYMGFSYLYDNYSVNSGLNTLTQSGISGFELGILQGIVRETVDAPGLSLLLKAGFPLGDDDSIARDGVFNVKMPLGDRGITLAAREVISRDLGEVLFCLNIGYELRLPYTQNYGSQGAPLSAARTFDPGDRFTYGIALERRFDGFSLACEITGCAEADGRLDGSVLAGSGTHVIYVLPGFRFFPNPVLTIDAGVKCSVYSRGGNEEYYYGPVAGLSQRF